VKRVLEHLYYSCFKDFLFLCLIFNHSQAEMLGEDVRIKFIFDAYDYHDNMENTSSLPFPFSYDIRNISLVEYYRDKEDNAMGYSRDDKEDTIDDRRDEKDALGDRRDVEPGRSLDIVKIGQDNGVLGEKRCVDKVVIETITEYKQEIKCDHSYDKQCHTSYITAYDGQQVCSNQ